MDEQKRINLTLRGLGGTGHIILGCLLQWFAKPSGYGADLTSMVGTGFVVLGVAQKLITFGEWFDFVSRRRKATEQPAAENDATLEQIAADLAWFREIKVKEIVRAKAAADARKNG